MSTRKAKRSAGKTTALNTSSEVSREYRDTAEQALATATPDQMPAGEVCCGLLNPALAKLQPGTAGPSGTLTGFRKAFWPVASHHHTTAGPAFRGGVRPRFFQGPERKA